MSFDVTGLTEIKGRTLKGWTTRFYVNEEGACVSKTCPSCEAVLAASEFARSSAMRFGLSGRCRKCNSDYMRAYWAKPSDKAGTSNGDARREARYERNRMRSDEEVSSEQSARYPDGTKWCRTCGSHKPLTEFYAARLFGDGLSPLCKSCADAGRLSRKRKTNETYWRGLSIPEECYMCAGPYEEVEHLVPRSHPRGYDVPENTRPSCRGCNRGPGGKWDTPLEEYIFSVNHPTKTRAKILHEIVMSGTWPFANTTPEEFIRDSLAYQEEETF